GRISADQISHLSTEAKAFKKRNRGMHHATLCML
ncbi:MAG: hypothetical protein ACI9ZD_002986, partial [Paracoccaceae bacterium]